MNEYPTQQEVPDAGWHLGRSWYGHHIEDECPCPQQPCGLVQFGPDIKGCPEHGILAGKTMRQGHAAADCPGAPSTARVRRGGA